MSPAFDLIMASDYRAIIRQEYQLRKARNPSYSLNAFAKQIGLTSSRLSAILKGAQGLSQNRAKQVAEKLGCTPTEVEYFADLVECEHGRTQLARSQASIRLARHRGVVEQQLERSEFDLLSKWYYAATIELIKIHGGKISTQKIATSLRISDLEAKDAVDVLIKLKQIKKVNGELIYKPRYQTASSATPSDTIRNFHKQMLSLAAEAIDRDHFKNRKSVSTIFSFDSNRMEEARLWLDKMHREFFKEFGAIDGANSVCGIGIQLHRIDQEVKNVQ